MRRAAGRNQGFDVPPSQGKFSLYEAGRAAGGRELVILRLRDTLCAIWQTQDR